ncbi:hypothetical protein [Duganella callida]|uniref:Carbohydrate esterase 2 N-terminal domain-containing protein n=1 Tax=Duganella callida TaxID=2561932 RepID=A0A4Y9S3A8_9BURK|nr:hypothetical protein [Duganella callida]TFW15822.1 hypothetical protein E4L98_25625 [Duganella callida]
MGATRAAGTGRNLVRSRGMSFYPNFEGTRLSADVQASGSRSYLGVIVDGVARQVRLAERRQTLKLAENLPAGPHTLEIVNRTETWLCTATLLDFVTAEKQAALRRYIEETVRIIGDRRVHAVASTGYPGDAIDAHPTKERHISMTNDLLPQVRAVMHW